MTMRAIGLRCEHREDIPCIDHSAPRFSWALDGGTPNETLPVVVYQFVGQYVSNWGYIFAAVVMASLPILIVFLLLQRYVIKGFASGLKG